MVNRIQNEPLVLKDAEVKIIVMIRSLRLFDKMEIKYSKQGELNWQLTKSDRGVYFLN